MKIRTNLLREYDEYVKLNSEDEYSKGVITFSERWANLMETEIDKFGISIIDCAERTSHEADTEGITGFMYGCAIHGLSKFWEYGDQLKEWHNKKYEYNGSGVVNPAIITISDKKD